jgi:hypothetical protein
MHQKVQGQIDEAGRSRQPDWLEIGQLKRLRLSIKDQMRRVLEGGRDIPWETPAAGPPQRQAHMAMLSRDA